MKRLASALVLGTLLATQVAAPACLRAQVPAPAAPVAKQDPTVPFRPFDPAAFAAALQQLGATPDQLAAHAKDAAEAGPARAGESMVRVLVPAYGKAMELADGGDPRAALELTRLLTPDAHVLVAAHVRYQLARLLIDADEPTQAVDVLEGFLRTCSNRTALDGEVVFFYAQAVAEVPNPELAVQLYRSFLKWFPDASERFRAVATQRAAELDRQLDSSLHTLADGMKKVGRDLRHQETGKPTQEKQKEFVTKLDELIEMFEQMERQSSGAASGNGPSSNPADQSSLPEGEARIGNLENVKKVADRWGDMKQKDREKIESEVQTNLPPQYRKMLEEYYKRLGTSKKQ